MDIMKTMSPVTAYSVTVLVTLVPELLLMIVILVTLTNISITILVITLAQVVLITLKTQPKLVNNVMLDVLFVMMKLITNVTNVTTHMFYSVTLVYLATNVPLTLDSIAIMTLTLVLLVITNVLTVPMLLTIVPNV
jgi:hypothetical protein